MQIRAPGLTQVRRLIQSGHVDATCVIRETVVGVSAAKTCVKMGILFDEAEK